MKNILFFLLFSSLGSMLMAQLSTQEEPFRYEKNKLYVKYKSSSSEHLKVASNRVVNLAQQSKIQSHIQKFGLHIQAMSMSLFEDEYLRNTLKIEFDSIQKIEELIQELEQDPQVEYVEKVPMYRLFAATNDPYATTLEGRNLKWHLDLINAQQAWEKQQASAHIKVAIVDGAVWGEHEDLQIKPENQYNAVSKEVGKNTFPANLDANKLCPDINDCMAYSWSHGTHCAGIVGAINNNGKGIASIGGGLTLMGVSVESERGFYIANAFDGILWAAENGAKVISCSWGGGPISRTNSNILKAIYQKGIVLIFASGNDNSSKITYPAGSPYVMSVGSVNSDKGPSSFSNYGTWVDIVAPGGFEVDAQGKETLNTILSSTYCINQKYRMDNYKELEGTFYDGMAGTSMSTPMIAGLAGLLLSKDSTLNMSMLRSLMIKFGQSINYTNSQKHFNVEASMIDASSALDYMKGVMAYPIVQAEVFNKQNIKISWTAPSQKAEKPVRYKIYRNREMIEENLTTPQFTELEMDYDEYLYEVQAVYADGSLSLKNGVSISLVSTTYHLSVEILPNEAGRVSLTGDCPQNELIEIEAYPYEGYSFVCWKSKNEILGTNRVLPLLLYKDTNLVAEFKKEVFNNLIMNAKTLSIIPNPATQKIEIISDESNFDQISIFNIDGKEVMKLNYPSNSTISIEKLTPGMYFLKTRKGKSTQMVKFVKQ